MNKTVRVIGGGLAGCEASYQLSKRGISVELYEAKPITMSEAHSDTNLCELVCSNSLKSDDVNTAHGLLKAELSLLDSFVLRMAKQCLVPAGGAVAVDRKIFAKIVTDEINKMDNVKVINGVVDSFDSSVPTIIASGPLTLGGLADCIKEKLNGSLSFFDAASPIITAESIDMDNAFYGSRYDKGNPDDYINCPLERDEYYAFVEELLKSEKAILKDFEKRDFFEGCMPVEIMASRGIDTLRFGTLKPVGFTDPKTGKRPYAIVQLRKENTKASIYNLVGFQTNLKFKEQKRVFSMIPALKNAEFLRYGVMHKNTYIDAPNVINNMYQVKSMPNIFVAGQLSGVEGYVESIASGLCSGINMANLITGKVLTPFPEQTMIGSLANYLATANTNFQPMNSNNGILPPLEEKIKDKSKRKEAQSVRSLEVLKKFIG